MKNLFILLILLSLFSCSSLKRGSNDNKKAMLAPENQEQLTNLTVTDQMLEGKRAMYTGDFAKALAHFMRCIKENPKHAASRYEISRIYELKNDYAKSVKWAQEAYDLNPDNVWYLRHYIEQLKKHKQYKEAASAMQTLVGREANDKQNYYDLANLHIYAKDYPSALKVYKQIEERFGFEEGVVLQRKQIYLNQNKLREAMDEVDLLIRHFPNESKYLGMKGHIFNMQGKHGEALKVYQKILEIDPDDGKVHLALASLYFSQGQKEKAFKEELIAFRNTSLNIDHKITTVMKYLKQEQLGKQDESHLVDLLSALEKTHPDKAKALAVNGDYYARKKQDAKALSYYKKVLTIDSTQYIIWEQVVLLYNEQEDHKKVKEYSEKALRLFPQHSALYFFSAMSSYALGDYDQAIEACELGANFTFAPAQQIDFLIMSGKAYSAKGDYENAIDQFNQVSYIKANVPEALAEKALCQALSNSNLSEAEQNIKSAIELDHTNPRYYYIYARVLFQQLKYTEAQYWIDKAVEVNADADSYELAGDIYNKQMDNSKAATAYRKALELGGNKKRIDAKLDSL